MRKLFQRSTGGDWRGRRRDGGIEDTQGRATLRGEKVEGSFGDKQMKGVKSVRLIAVCLLLAMVAATSGCDSGGDDPITLFGPSPEIRISTNPDVIGPSETTVVTVQLLNNGNPVADEEVFLAASGGVFVPAGASVPDVIEENIVTWSLRTDQQGIASVALYTETLSGPNMSGIAKVTATALGTSKTVEIRLFLTPPPPGTGGEGDQTEET